MVSVTEASVPYTVEKAAFVTVENATSAIDDFKIRDYSLAGTITVGLGENRMSALGLLTTEGLFIGSKAYKGITLPLEEQARLWGSSTKGIGLSKEEAVLAAEASPAWNIHASKLEAAGLADALANAIRKPLTESVVQAADEARHSVGVHRYPRLRVGGSAYKSTGLKSQEEACLTDDGRRHMAVFRTGRMKAYGFITKRAVASNFYTLGIREDLSRLADFNRTFSGRTKVSEAAGNAIGAAFYEQVQAEINSIRMIGKALAESAAASASMDRTWRAGLRVAETLPVAEELARRIIVPKAASLSLTDVRILPNPGGVLSDIYVSGNGITLDEFESLASKPSGYTPFTEFKVGEYEYQDAMYRMVIRKDNIVANPLIHGYAIHVDIDDVKDRGTATVPAEETKVYFNRNYYTTPDVVVNVVGGTEGDVVIPVITGEGTDDAGRYFTVILKNAAGTAVSGSISWNSNGY